MTDTSPPPDTIDPILGAVFPAYAVLAGMQLDVFTPLKDGPLGAEEIAADIGVDSDGLERLLYALVVAGALTVEGGRFSNTPASDYFLVRGRPAFYGDGHEFWSEIWQAVGRTADSIRAGAPQARHDYRQMGKDEQLAFFRGLHSGTKAEGYNLAQRHDFSAYRSLLDVAGGSGGMAIALTEVYPHLQATVVDLPEVTPVTEHFIAEEAATDRVKVIAADMVEEALSGEFDLAILKSFTQILAPAQVRRVLKNVHDVLRPGGAVYIISSFLDNSRTSPVGAVYWDLVFLNIYDGGRSYTEQQYQAWLTEAGFIAIEWVGLQDQDRMLVARKPS